eukprot:scaffold303795_cov32-Tisochrysis_lutea.AAC.1
MPHESNHILGRLAPLLLHWRQCGHEPRPQDVAASRARRKERRCRQCAPQEAQRSYCSIRQPERLVWRPKLEVKGASKW